MTNRVPGTYTVTLNLADWKRVLTALDSVAYDFDDTDPDGFAYRNLLFDLSDKLHKDRDAQREKQ